MHPTILQIGPIEVRAYPFMLTLAFLAGTLLAVREGKRYGISPHEATRFATLIIVSSIVGSRGLYVLEHYRSFCGHSIHAAVLWQGGLSYHGGLLLAILCGCLWLRVRRISTGAMLDSFAPGLILGFFFVRIGCFLNGCCFGTPTDMPWGIVFPPNCPAGWVYENVKIHPVQLYASFSGLMGFFILLGIEKRSGAIKGSGWLFASFLVLSSSWRFILEFFRYHEPHSNRIGGLTAAQGYASVILICSVFAISWIYKQKGKAGREWFHPVPHFRRAESTTPRPKKKSS